MPARAPLRTAAITAGMITATTLTGVSPGSAAVTTTSPTTTAHRVVTRWTPVADTLVRSTAPRRSYGSKKYLQADGSPVVRSYLRFRVKRVPRGPKRTYLRIRHSTANRYAPFCDSGRECWHPTKIKVRTVSRGRWNERTTYATAPAPGRLLGTSAGISGRGMYWVEIDLGRFVKRKGIYEVVITGSSVTNQTFASRESGSPPQLIVRSTR